jgi:hypothetical protein
LKVGKHQLYGQLTELERHNNRSITTGAGMETRQYQVYKFSELSDKAKEKAISYWYEHEDFPMLEEDLTESCKELLKQNKIDNVTDDLKLYYDLSCSQGSGLCFIGSFTWKKYYILIKHVNNHYYHNKTTSITVMNDDGNEIDSEKTIGQFRSIYFDICNKLEKDGRNTVDYRMDNAEFNELCETNDYMFTANGKID